MRIANPSNLRIGMSGILEGRHYRVAGRVVLKSEADGETYFWNEFNLLNDSGESATLVYEDSESDSPWKLFFLLQPSQPLGASQASAMRVGDRVSVDGKSASITLLGQSRVVHVEGTAPEGVEVGDVANYFNATYAEKMIVVSWSGEEVEHYEGVTVAAGRVESAFGLSTRAAAPLSMAVPKRFWSDPFTLVIGAVVLIALAALGYVCYTYVIADGGMRNAAPAIAPASQITLRQRATIQGHMYTVGGHALVEVARTGRKYQCHEYLLSEETGAGALLVNALSGRAGDWFLLETTTPTTRFDPYDAAALQVGQDVTVSGQAVHIAQVLMARVLSREGASTDPVWSATLQYGFVAKTREDGWLLARWNEESLQLYLGRVVSDADVMAAFKK